MRIWTTIGPIVLIIALTLSACQAAPAATPTAVPPTPTKAAAPPTQPPAPAVVPTATTAAAIVPTATRPPAPTATAVPKATAKGKLTMANNQEPPSLDAQMKDETGMRTTTQSIIEQLTDRDSKTMVLKGTLAEKWEKKDNTTWRFTLRKGIKFHNGEALDGEGTAWAINRAVNPDLNSGLLGYFSTVKEAKAVDAQTVDIITKDNDPILPARMYFLPIIPAKWAKENPELLNVQAIGTGAYKLAEWNRGQFIKLTANEDYWGEAKPTIKDIVIVPRSEAQVRAAMVKTGEAQIARFLTPELVKDMPKVGRIPSLETVIERLDVAHPVLKDRRVRQAMNYAADRKSIVDKIFGGFATLARGQMISSAVLGFNPSLDDYPFDMAKAKSLVAEAKGAGIPVDTNMELVVQKGRFPRDVELGESLVAAWNDAGLKVKLRAVERAQYVDLLWGTQAAGFKDKANLTQVLHGNELLDASRSFEAWLQTGGRGSLFSDADLDKMVKDGAAESDIKKREQIFQQAFKRAHDEAGLVVIATLDFLWGMSKNVEWQLRADDLVRFNEVKLTN